MYYAEYWDDEEGEYVGECFSDEETCRDWAFEHSVPTYTYREFEDAEEEEFYV